MQRVDVGPMKMHLATENGVFMHKGRRVAIAFYLNNFSMQAAHGDHHIFSSLLNRFLALNMN